MFLTLQSSENDKLYLKASDFEYQMKSTHWAPEEQTMCWSGSDAAACVGGCRAAGGRQSLHPREASSQGRGGWGSLTEQD